MTLDLVGTVPTEAELAAFLADYTYREGGGIVGVIASVSRPFCGHCNRLRLTADGKLRNCLFALDESDARALLRTPGSPDAALADMIRRSVWAKWAGHEFQLEVRPSQPADAVDGHPEPGFLRLGRSPVERAPATLAPSSAPLRPA